MNTITCRNRHCPKCQNTERARWLESRRGELLPVDYFHVVFTVPEQIARLAFYNKAAVYGILFRAAAQALLTIARDPKHLGAEIGSSAYCTPGGRTCSITPTSTSLSPAAALVPTSNGFPAARVSFSPCGYLRACSAVCFSNT